MKSQKIILISLLFWAVVGFKSSMGGRLLQNGLFISPENPSLFDPKLNSVIQVTSTSSGVDPFKHPKEKTGQPCGMVDDKMKEAPNFKEIVLNVLAKTSVTPSGGSERGNNGIRSAHRLAKSTHSPGVGHLQIFIARKSPTYRKRILKSTPSPGARH